MQRWRQRLGGCRYEMRNPRIAGSLKEPEEAGTNSPRAFGRSVVLPTPCFCTSGFRNCGRINFCCFKVPSLRNLFQQPQEANPSSYSSSR